MLGEMRQEDVVQNTKLRKTDEVKLSWEKDSKTCSGTAEKTEINITNCLKTDQIALRPPCVILLYTGR